MGHVILIAVEEMGDDGPDFGISLFAAAAGGW